jgi:hypothetical protein
MNNDQIVSVVTSAGTVYIGISSLITSIDGQLTISFPQSLVTYQNKIGITSPVLVEEHLGVFKFNENHIDRIFILSPNAPILHLYLSKIEELKKKYPNPHELSKDIQIIVNDNKREIIIGKISSLNKSYYLVERGIIINMEDSVNIIPLNPFETSDVASINSRCIINKHTATAIGIPHPESDIVRKYKEIINKIEGKEHGRKGSPTSIN